MNIVFFGTPDFATILLDHLHEAGLTPTLIVTQPDRPKGRKLELTPPAVKVWAQNHSIDVIQPENLKDADELDVLINSEWDLFIVAAYGLIVPNDILNLPKHGTINVHPSLLPKYRGPTPVQSQLLSDDRECGVSIMLLDEKMDHGPILSQASITPEEWPLKASLLNDILWNAGGELLIETIFDWTKGVITPEEQNHDQATFTSKVSKSNGEIKLDDDPYQNYLKFCAFDPWPGVYFFNENNKRMKITDAEWQGGSFRILKVIPEGEKEQPYQG